MSTNVAVLTSVIETRRLVYNGWGRQTFARDANYHMCYWGSNDARFFCLMGAIYRATDWRNTYNSKLCLDVIEAVVDHIGIEVYGQEPSECVVFYNDAPKRTKDEVLDVLDRTIASLMKIEPPIEVQSKEFELA